MPSIFIRLGKRIAVLIPGLIIAYLSVFVIFPRLDNHLPLLLAILLTYILGAYVLIPALIRISRIFFPPKHLPLYCITPDGFASDPLNIGLIGTRAELTEAMLQSGWFLADKHTIRNTIRQVLSTIYGWSYPNAPMSSLYLFGRTQDVGFQLPIKDAAAGSRHHVRFWATTYSAGKKLSVRSINWRERSEHVRGDRLLWVGAASRDVGVSFIRHNAQVTHMIDPDTDSERSLIVQNLRDAKVASNMTTVKLGDPYKVSNRVLLGYLKSDGKMSVMEITPKTVKTN